MQKIWRKIKCVIRREKFDNDAVFDDKYLKTKIKT